MFNRFPGYHHYHYSLYLQSPCPSAYIHELIKEIWLDVYGNGQTANNNIELDSAFSQPFAF